MDNNYDSQGPVVRGVSIGFAVLTFIVLSVRLFSRLYVMGRMGVDDYLIIGACLLSWAFIGAVIAAVDNGLGMHMEDVDKSNMAMYSFSVWLSSMFYLACLGFVKASVLVFYTRLGDRYLTRMAIVMLAVVTSQAVANVLTAAFQCQPVKKAWITKTQGKCVNINAFYLANAALNILTDVLTYTLPMKVIIHLQIPRKQKIALWFILSLGLFACISSVIRITYVPPMLSSPDATYVISGAMYWSVIETNIAILAASAPSFKAIASRFLPRIVGEYSNRKRSGPLYGNSYSRRYGSGFSKVRDPNTITLGNFQASDPVGTEVYAGQKSNSSVERIIPHGKIVTETHISTNVEVGHDYDELPASFERRR